MNAELAGRIAAAAAVLADYQRDALGWLGPVFGAAEPDWQQWAGRLAGMLRPVLELAELLNSAPVSGDTDAGSRLQQIRDVLEVFDWQSDDTAYCLEQIEDIALRGMS